MKLPISIQSNDRQNADLFIGLGLVIAVLNLLVHSLFLQQMYIVNMFLYGFAIALALLGWLKHGEPRNLLTLTPEGLLYWHRKQRLFIPWQNIQRIDIPYFRDALGYQELDYIGVKVKDLESFYDNFPLRLASKLLVEHRPLLMTVAGRSCKTGQCVPEDFVDAVEYKLDSGKVYKGLIGMFVNRTEVMQKNLGFHFYIPLKSTDLPAHKLLNLLKEAKNSASNVQTIDQP